MSFLEPAHFRHGKTVSRGHKNQLLKQEKLTSEGWIGDGVERDWFGYMKDAVLRKTLKASSSGFESFQDNWLLVYDNTPAMFKHKELLLPYVEQLWSAVKPHYFNFIFVETRWLEKNSSSALPIILAVSEKSVNVFPIIDLWQ